MSTHIDTTELAAVLKKEFPEIASVDMTEEETVHITLSPHCVGCPMRSMTLEEDILAAAKVHFPEIGDVSVGDDVSEETMTLLRDILHCKA